MTPDQIIKKYWWIVLIPVGLALFRKHLTIMMLEAGKAGLDVVTSPVAAAGQWVGELFYPPNPVAPASSTMTPEQYYALSDDQRAALRPRILSGDIRINWK